METDHKHRGFMRNKLVKTFSKVTKRNGNNKVMPTQISNNRNGSVTYLSHQDMSNSSSMQKAVSTSSKVNYQREESVYANNNGPLGYYGGGGGGGDENVDIQASKYILYVKERFKQERVEMNAIHDASDHRHHAKAVTANCSNS
ncbi:hypothetical protein Patl1_16967 [Pistacia atlantica]|uniref:Uncharacterized protein n=1 Tax=Pistacia atlantica TaxID=434234 RepID=A0ACC1B5R7_9ROSI|nr:hypothetical protein Patl1_16967 [Pistacia atlantica]